MSHATCPSFKIMFGNLQHVPQRELGALGEVGRERSSPGPGSSLGEERKTLAWAKKKSASEASREVAWGGERVVPPFSPLAPGTAGPALRSPIFFLFDPVFAFSSTAEPGSMRREGRIHFLSGTFFFSPRHQRSNNCGLWQKHPNSWPCS